MVLFAERQAVRVEVCIETGNRGALGSASAMLAGPIGLFLAGLYQAQFAPPVEAFQVEEDHESTLRELVERQAMTTLAAVGSRNEEDEAARMRHLGRELLSRFEPRREAELREEELGFGTPLTDQEATYGIARMQRRWNWLQKNWERFGWSSFTEKRVF